MGAAGRHVLSMNRYNDRHVLRDVPATMKSFVDSQRSTEARQERVQFRQLKHPISISVVSRLDSLSAHSVLLRVLLLHICAQGSGD